MKSHFICQLLVDFEVKKPNFAEFPVSVGKNNKRKPALQQGSVERDSCRHRRFSFCQMVYS